MSESIEYFDKIIKCPGRNCEEKLRVPMGKELDHHTLQTTTWVITCEGYPVCEECGYQVTKEDLEDLGIE
jgi:hypothetical protein